MGVHRTREGELPASVHHIGGVRRVEVGTDGGDAAVAHRDGAVGDRVTARADNADVADEEVIGRHLGWLLCVGVVSWRA